MDASICQRLSRVELDFLLALQEGDDAIAAFERNWSALLSEVDQRETLGQDVLELAHIVASRLSILSESLLDFQLESDSLTSTLNGEVEEILQDLHLSEPEPSASD